MRAIRSVVFASIILAMMTSAGPALAGGWATTRFDQAPSSFQEGVEYQLTWTVLQHGRTPVDVESSAVEFTSAESDQLLTFQAESTDLVGQYTATVLLPEEGAWTWSVDQGSFGPLPLGELDVAPAAAGSPPSALVIGLVIAATAAIVWAAAGLRTRRHPSVAPVG